MGRPASDHPVALVVDDEPHLADALVRQLAEAWPELRIGGVAGNGREALQLLEQQDPQVLFLDIRMPGLSGLDVAARVGSGVQIVFVTAYHQYAIDAFEHAAVDYLLKPVSAARLAVTVQRLRARLSAADARADGDTETDERAEAVRALLARLEHPLPNYRRWLTVSRGDAVELLETSRILYLRASQKYTSAFTADREYLIRVSLKTLQAELDPERFRRIHRNTIVNLEAIRDVRRDYQGRCELTLHQRAERLSVSRAYRELFRPL